MTIVCQTDKTVNGERQRRDNTQTTTTRQKHCKIEPLARLENKSKEKECALRVRWEI